MTDILAISAIIGVIGTISGGTFWAGRFSGRVNGRIDTVDRVNNERYGHVCQSLQRIEGKIDSLECNPEHGGFHDNG